MTNLNTNYFIAETAFHHEGDIEFLEKLIESILELEVQAIKFHLLFDVDDYMIASHSAIEVIKKIIISQNHWENIFNKVKQGQKEIVALTNDVKSLEFINSIQNEYPIEAIELHSTGLNDIYLLQAALGFNKTIIIGVGGSTFDEVQFAVDFLKKNGKNDILLMHGFQNYPTNYEDINFKRIDLLQKAFGLSVGYADHTDPLDDMNALMSVFPIAYGVKVFEKHVTNVFGEKRIDAQAAISLDTMKDVIKMGDSLAKTLGSSPMQFSEPELNYGNTGPMKKALVAKKNIEKGEVLTNEHIAFKRTEQSSPLLQKDFSKVLGSVAINDIQKDEILSFSNLEYSFKKPSLDQFFINTNK